MASNQRARMYGAMMESLARTGYAETSVAEVCRLAGVSKRTFYEHFSNKEACFVRLTEMMLHRLAVRIVDASERGDEDLDARIETLLRALGEEVKCNPNGMRFLLTQMPTRAPGGWVGVDRLMSAITQTIVSSLEKSPELGAIRRPIGRGVVGGLRWMVTMALAQRGVEDLDSIAVDMRDWVKLFDSPVAIPLEDWARVPRRANQRPEMDLADDRARLQEAILASIAEGSDALSPASRASDGGVALGRFYPLFETRDQCVVSVFGTLGDELLQIVCGSTRPGEDWPVRTYSRVTSLLCHLAAMPVYAEVLTKAPRVLGSVGVGCNLAVTLDIARVLSEEAPSRPAVDRAVEGIAGAFSWIVTSEVDAGRVLLLPKQAPVLTYFVLTPFLGAENAIAAIERAVSR